MLTTVLSTQYQIDGKILTALASVTVALLAFTGQIHAKPSEQIAFSSARDGNNEIYVMKVDGTDQKRLTVNTGYDGIPSFSSDGKRIAFESIRDGAWKVYVMNADGSGQTRLTAPNTFYDGRPSFSPDGRKIAFDSNRDGKSEVYVMNSDGTGQTSLTRGTGGFDPSFSPNGQKIAFFSYRDGSYKVYVMNADGTGQTRLTNTAANDTAPSFSPDGKKIVFVSERDGNSEIYVMNADGTGQTNLTRNAAYDAAPSFSPDGQKIAFQSYRDGNYEIYVMNADGTGQTNISKAPASQEHAPSFPVPLPEPELLVDILSRTPIDDILNQGKVKFAVNCKLAASGPCSGVWQGISFARGLTGPAAVSGWLSGGLDTSAFAATFKSNGALALANDIIEEMAERLDCKSVAGRYQDCKGKIDTTVGISVTVDTVTHFVAASFTLSQ